MQWVPVNIFRCIMPLNAAQKASSPPERGAAPSRFRAWHAAGLVLLLGVGALLVYAFWPALAGAGKEAAREPTAEPGEAVTRVEAVVVARGAFPLRAEATGHLAPWKQAGLGAEASGVVVERPVEEGQYVEEGALLVRLDDREARIDVAEARADVLEARSVYAVDARREAGFQSTADTADVAAARERLREAEAAHAQGRITAQELAAIREELDTEELLAGRRRSDVQAVAAGLTQAEQRLARAELALSRTRLTAPFAGRVADLDVEAGQRVAAGQELMTLVAESPMKVEVDVLGEDLVGIEAGRSARVRVPAMAGRGAEGPPVYEGRVHTVNPRVDPATGTGRVTVTIPNPDGALVAGLFAEVFVETQRLPDRLVVPAEAVLLRQGRDLVFVVRGGRAQWVYVEVGARSGDHVVVTDGVQPGDTVAVDGHFALAHDAPVEVAGVRPAFGE